MNEQKPRAKKRIIRSVIQVFIALFCLLIIHQLFWIFVLDFNSKFRVINPAVWLKPENSSPRPTALSFDTSPIITDQPYINLTAIAPPNRYLNLIVNDQNYRVDYNYRGVIDYYQIPLRKGLNRMGVVVRKDANQVDPYFRNMAVPLDVIYRSGFPRPPQLLGIVSNNDGIPHIYGFADPADTIHVKTPGFMSQIITDQIGVFSFGYYTNPPAEIDTIQFSARATPFATEQSPVEVTLDSAAFHTGFSEVKPVLKRTTDITVNRDLSYYIRLSLAINHGNVLYEMLSQNLMSTREIMLQLFGFWDANFLSSDWRSDESFEEHHSIIPTDESHNQFTYSMNLSGQLQENGYIVLGKTISSNLPPLLSEQDSLILRAPNLKNINFSYLPENADATVKIWTGRTIVETKPVLMIEAQTDRFMAGAISESDENSQTLFSRLKDVQRKTPRNLSRIFLALLSAIPFFWLLKIIQSKKQKQILGYDATLYAVTKTFLLFHIAILILPLFSSIISFINSWLILIFSGSKFAYSYAHNLLSIFQDIGHLYPFLAIAMMVLMIPIYKAIRAHLATSSPQKKAREALIRWLVFYPLGIALPVALFMTLYFLRSDRWDLYYWISSPQINQALILFFIVGLALFWIFLYWLFRIILYRPINFRSAIFASWSMILIPIIPLFFHSVNSYVRYFFVQNFEIYPFFLPYRFDNILWFLIVLIFGSIVLYHTSYLTIRMGQFNELKKKFKSRWTWIIIILFFLTNLLLKFVLGDSRNTTIDEWNFRSLAFAIDDLLPYILIIGLIVYLKRIRFTNPFELPTDSLEIGTLLFAFYLTGRTANLWFVPIPLFLGYVIFKKWIIHPNPFVIKHIADKNLVKNLLEFRRASRMNQLLKRNLEKKYSQGDIALKDMNNKIKESDDFVRQLKEGLKKDQPTTQQIIFGLGPEGNPWQNAMKSVFYGLLLSIPFQLNTILKIFDSTHWGDYPLLEIIEALCFSSSTYILIAFVFGYFFHVIRGRDGLEKALYFSVALVIPTIPQRLIQAQPLLGPDHIVQMVQILAFVLILSLLVFELRTLQKLNYSWRDLLSIHGWTKTTAYGSSIVLTSVASVTGKDILPLLRTIVNWITGLEI